jgi:C4-dicarboxylate-specific signal transduction histidine kinase
VEQLMEAVRQIAGQVAGNRAIAFEIDAEDAIPPLYVDRVQVEVVLRNLLANAVDAVGAADSPRVRVLAARNGEAEMRLVVADSGPGLAREATERVFEPFVSGKPTGLGIGLAISRAIAEAHGGTLAARAGNHGEFHLVLPCQTPT